MIIQEVITHRLLIERMGERRHFQISLPRDTSRIIGVEYGTLEKDGVILPGGGPVPAISDYFKVKASKIIGRLTLKTTSAEGLFFQGDLVEDRNSTLHEIVAGVAWQPKPWTHGSKREETSFLINTPMRFVDGMFEDRYGIGEYQILTYQLGLFLWIEKCSV
jgi:hypothetical protein